MSPQETQSTAPPAPTRNIERQLTIDAPIDAVWKALTDAEELARWFPLDARVKPGVDGSVWLSWGDLYEEESTIQVWESGRHLRIAFPVEKPGVLATDYYLEAKGGSTVLRVVTSGFGEGADWDEQYAGVGLGWDFELRGLKHYLERHRGEDRLVAWAQVPLGADLDQAWSRLTGPGGWCGESGLRSLEAGRRFSATTPGGEISGEVGLWQPPRQFAGTVENLNDAYFRIELHPSGGGSAVVWLSAYGVDAKEVRRLEETWRASLTSLFASD